MFFLLLLLRAGPHSGCIRVICAKSCLPKCAHERLKLFRELVLVVLVVVVMHVQREPSVVFFWGRRKWNEGKVQNDEDDDEGDARRAGMFRTYERMNERT